MQSSCKSLKNNFEKFSCMKYESLHALIERYYQLLDQMHNHGIVTTNAETVQCLAYALPVKWDSFIMRLRNTDALSRLNINDFVKMLREHELDIENKGSAVVGNLTKDEEVVVRAAGSTTEEQVNTETSTACAKCIELEDFIAKLQLSNQQLSDKLNANLVIKETEKQLKAEIETLKVQVHDLKVTVLNKQDGINFYIDTIDKLKRERDALRVDYETLDLKLNSYASSSYILDHMIKERKGPKGQGIGYNECPPPYKNQYLSKTSDDPLPDIDLSSYSSESKDSESDNFVSKSNDKGKSVELSESSDVTEKKVPGQDYEEFSTPGLGSTSNSTPASNPVDKPESKPVKKVKSKSSKSKPKRQKVKPDFSPVTKPVTFIKEGEQPKVPLSSPNVKTGYVPPHKRNVNQEPRVEKKVAPRPAKLVDRRTCFDCGKHGHVAWSCPKSLRTPPRKVDLTKTFTEISIKSKQKVNRFFKNRSTSPVKSRAFIPSTKIFTIPNVKQSTVYHKQSPTKSHLWKSKCEGGGSSSDSDVSVTSLGSNGQWMDLQVFGVDRKPHAIRAWVPIVN